MNFDLVDHVNIEIVSNLIVFRFYKETPKTKKKLKIKGKRKTNKIEARISILTCQWAYLLNNSANQSEIDATEWAYLVNNLASQWEVDAIQWV